MSASAANVPCGSMKQIAAATTNSPPKIAETQRIAPPAAPARAKFWAAANMNNSPTRTPTVVTEAESN